MAVFKNLVLEIRSSKLRAIFLAAEQLLSSSDGMPSLDLVCHKCNYNFASSV